MWGFSRNPFGNDPFFSDHQTSHENDVRRTFRSFEPAFHPALQDAPYAGTWPSRGQELSPFTGFFGGQDPFAHMQTVMSQMDSNPDSHSFSSSTVMSYSSNGSGEAPRMYQASTQERRQPGGLKETRKAVRDSHTGEERVLLGKNVGDRGRIVERKRNHKTGEAVENKQYFNMGEEDDERFVRDFNAAQSSSQLAWRPDRGQEHPALEYSRPENPRPRHGTRRDRMVGRKKHDRYDRHHDERFN